MDTAVHAIAPHSPDSLRAVPSGQSLAVSAVYQLSEAGRKASLMAGGDGKGVQRLTVQVPATRLHLVTVGVSGQAKLKLQPHFDRVDGQVVRRDSPPVFDAPPTLDELLHLAARNHELAREFRSSRSGTRDDYRERRAEVARAFLGDQSQRAMVRPVPTPRRCFLATSSGRLMFDATLDVGPAAQVPEKPTDASMPTDAPDGTSTSSDARQTRISTRRRRELSRTGSPGTGQTTSAVGTRLGSCPSRK